MLIDLEFAKTVINAITNKFRHIKSDVDAVKSDVDAVKSDAPNWDEHNSASHAYIKNKPCYDYVEPFHIIWEANSAGTSDRSSLILIDLVDGYLIQGEEYKLTVDGVSTVYTCKQNEDGRLWFGVGSTIYDGSVYQDANNLCSFTQNLWTKGQKVRLEGSLRRYKKLDTNLYDAVVSVNDETGKVQITPDNIGAASVGNKIIPNFILNGVIYGTYNGKTCRGLYLGGNRYFYKETTGDTGEDCFVFGPFDTLLAGIKTPTSDNQAANKGYVDKTVADARKSIRLYSSTDGSTKQFEITVNDDGVISATEVAE